MIMFIYDLERPFVGFGCILYTIRGVIDKFVQFKFVKLYRSSYLHVQCEYLRDFTKM